LNRQASAASARSCQMDGRSDKDKPGTAPSEGSAGVTEHVCTECGKHDLAGLMSPDGDYYCHWCWGHWTNGVRLDALEAEVRELRKVNGALQEQLSQLSTHMQEPKAVVQQPAESPAPKLDFLLAQNHALALKLWEASFDAGAELNQLGLSGCGKPLIASRGIEMRSWRGMPDCSDTPPKASEHSAFDDVSKATPPKERPPGALQRGGVGARHRCASDAIDDDEPRTARGVPLPVALRSASSVSCDDTSVAGHCDAQSQTDELLAPTRSSGGASWSFSSVLWSLYGQSVAQCHSRAALH